MCLECGYYKGKMVVDMVAKKKAREARREEKLEAIRSMGAAQAPEQSEEKK
jgi:hypothetical protein